MRSDSIGIFWDLSGSVLPSSKDGDSTASLGTLLPVSTPKAFPTELVTRPFPSPSVPSLHPCQEALFSDEQELAFVLAVL